MRILITGATGFIGQILVNHLLQTENELIALTRNPEEAQKILPTQCKVLHWDQLSPEVVHNVEAVVNLAGHSVAGPRWSSKYKQKILNSRVDCTKKLVECINARPAKSSLEVFLSASAVGFYGDRADEVLLPESGPGKGFLSEVCQKWEAEASNAKAVRVVIPRIGMVLDPSGGALKKILPVFKMGMGGELGSGLQWMSWIHIQDLVRIFDFFLNEERAIGIFNAVAPYPVTNKEFTKDLASALSAKIFFSTPAIALKILFGEMATLFLSSQRAVPSRSLRLGFQFHYPTLSKAFESFSKDKNFRQFFPFSSNEL